MLFAEVRSEVQTNSIHPCICEEQLQHVVDVQTLQLQTSAATYANLIGIKTTKSSPDIQFAIRIDVATTYPGQLVGW